MKKRIKCRIQQEERERDALKRGVGGVIEIWGNLKNVAILILTIVLGRF